MDQIDLDSIDVDGALAESSAVAREAIDTGGEAIRTRRRHNRRRLVPASCRASSWAAATAD